MKGNANSFTRNNKLSLLTILNHFQGIGNLVGSFFSCMPFTASLSRSLIQQTVGGRTQLASLISCGILVSVLLWIGPFFEPLPRVIEIKNLLKRKKHEKKKISLKKKIIRDLYIYIYLHFPQQCVLASIIVVALKGMLMKVTEFKRFWKLDRIDGIIWAVTFTTVILLDVEYGLLIGIVFCVGKLIFFSVHPYTCSLALVPGTELYLDTKRYKGVRNNDSLSLSLSFFLFYYSIHFHRIEMRNSYNLFYYLCLLFFRGKTRIRNNKRNNNTEVVFYYRPSSYQA